MCLATPQHENRMTRPRPAFGAAQCAPFGVGCAAARYARLRCASPEGGAAGRRKHIYRKQFTPAQASRFSAPSTWGHCRITCITADTVPRQHSSLRLPAHLARTRFKPSPMIRFPRFRHSKAALFEALSTPLDTADTGERLNGQNRTKSSGVLSRLRASDAANRV